MKNKLFVFLLALTLIFTTSFTTFATESDVENEPTVKEEVTEIVDEVKEDEPIVSETKEDKVTQEEKKEEAVKEEPTKVEEPAKTVDEPKEEKAIVAQKMPAKTTKSTAKAAAIAEYPKLTITFKYRDSNNNAEWTTSSLSNEATSWNVLQAKANNVIANHRTITVGLTVYTFTGWDTTFPVTLNAENPNVTVTAQYSVEQKPQLTFVYKDNVSTGSGSWENESPFSGYTHTFKKPADVPQYTFLYWENEENGDIKKAGEKFKMTASELTQNTKITYVAKYDFQPYVKLIYHFKGGIRDTGAKSKAIDIYKSQPKDLKWFYEEEGGEPIPVGEKIPLPEKIEKVSTKQDTTPVKVDVYAHYYTVTWENWDESVLEKDSDVPYGNDPSYDGEAPTRKATAQYTYTFDKWTPELNPVTGDVTYTATYTQTVNKYTVTWENYDGTVLEKDTEVPYGDTPTYDGQTPEKPKTAQYNYTFIGWEPTISEVTGDATYTAQYVKNINNYKVTWQDWDETILEVDEEVPYGEMPEYNGDTPTKPSTAQYSYEFIGWDPEVKEVEKEIVYTAQYKEILNAYTVTWVNYDDEVLEEDIEVPYGEMPSYDSDTPKKPSTSEYSYEFVNWEPDVDVVTGDAIYKAVYKEIPNPVIPDDPDDPVAPTKPTKPTKPDTPTNDDDDNPVTKVTKTKKTTVTNTIISPWIDSSEPDVFEEMEPTEEVEEEPIERTIPGTGIPTTNIGAWALINLIAMLFTILLSIIMLIFFIINKIKEKDDDEEDNENEEKVKYKNKLGLRIITAIIAIISLIIFIFTEDMTLPMVLTDKYTFLMIVIAIIQIIVAILSKRKKEEEENEQE